MSICVNIAIPEMGRVSVFVMLADGRPEAPAIENSIRCSIARSARRWTGSGMVPARGSMSFSFRFDGHGRAVGIEGQASPGDPVFEVEASRILSSISIPGSGRSIEARAFVQIGRVDEAVGASAGAILGDPFAFREGWAVAAVFAAGRPSITFGSGKPRDGRPPDGHGKRRTPVAALPRVPDAA